MVARIIQELKTRCLVVARMMPNMQVFLMNCLMAKTNPLYLPSSDRFITDVNSLKTILDGP